MKTAKHPTQPIQRDKHGTLRFKKNLIVEHLLDNGGIGMNDLAMIDFSQEDRVQFAQLIGYSLDGFGTLSYVDDDSYDIAEKMYVDKMPESDSKIEVLEGKLEKARELIKKLAVEVFRIHPDDLHP